jgi:hypothetical protein
MKCKNVLLILFSILTIAARCIGQDAVTKIEFTTLTRGYQKQVFIDADSLIVIVDGRQEPNKVVKRALPKGSWDDINRVLQNVTYESPSNRRAFDGAKHSTLKLITRDGKDFSHTFDDLDPHPALKPLLEVLLEIENDDRP